MRLVSQLSEFAFFGASALVGALFNSGGIVMNEKAPEKVIDSTDTELTPGKPTVCLGNGEKGLECCCDGCNYFLLCFPEYELMRTQDLDYETVEEMISARLRADNDHSI